MARVGLQRHRKENECKKVGFYNSIGSSFPLVQLAFQGTNETI